MNPLPHTVPRAGRLSILALISLSFVPGLPRVDQSACATPRHRWQGLGCKLRGADLIQPTAPCCAADDQRARYAQTTGASFLIPSRTAGPTDLTEESLPDRFSGARVVTEAGSVTHQRSTSRLGDPVPDSLPS